MKFDTQQVRNMATLQFIMTTEILIAEFKIHIDPRNRSPRDLFPPSIIQARVLFVSLER